VAGFTILGTLMALAVLEHWFLVLPVPVAALWRWGFRSRDTSVRIVTGPPARPRYRMGAT
jgi:hypothetical protein